VSSVPLGPAVGNDSANLLELGRRVPRDVHVFIIIAIGLGIPRCFWLVLRIFRCFELFSRNL
jgi:hypothetical protein